MVKIKVFHLLLRQGGTKNKVGVERSQMEIPRAALNAPDAGTLVSNQRVNDEARYRITWDHHLLADTLGIQQRCVRMPKSVPATTLFACRIFIASPEPGAPADLQCRSTGEFTPREGQSSGLLSLRAALEDSWLERRRQTKVEVRSETQPDHAGERHRANLPSGTQWLQKRPIR